MFHAQVELDNALSKAYTKVELRCLDRKGLLFDLMRTLKDIGVRVAYGAPQSDSILSFNAYSSGVSS